MPFAAACAVYRRARSRRCIARKEPPEGRVPSAAACPPPPPVEREAAAASRSRSRRRAGCWLRWPRTPAHARARLHSNDGGCDDDWARQRPSPISDDPHRANTEAEPLRQRRALPCIARSSSGLHRRRSPAAAKPTVCSCVRSPDPARVFVAGVAVPPNQALAELSPSAPVRSTTRCANPFPFLPLPTNALLR